VYNVHTRTYANTAYMKEV